MGFRSVEAFGLPLASSRLKDALLASNLEIPTAHGSVANNTAASIESALELGVQVLIEPYQPSESFSSLDEIRRLADQLSTAAQAAKPQGIKIGYHNHDHELSNLIGGKPALLVLAEETSNDVVFEVDLFWVQAGGQNSVEILQTLGNRVVALHAKDAPAGAGADGQVPAGKGDVPLLEAIATATDARIVIEFDNYAGDIFEGIAESLTFLRSEGK